MHELPRVVLGLRPCVDHLWKGIFTRRRTEVEKVLNQRADERVRIISEQCSGYCRLDPKEFDKVMRLQVCLLKHMDLQLLLPGLSGP